MVRKSLLKILQAEFFATISPEGFTRNYLTKTTTCHDSSASSHELLTCPFRGNLCCKLVAKCTNLQLSLSLHQLNTKPNKIKSHKI